MQIQFKKTIINSQLNSKRQKGAPLSAPNSAYTKVDTFLLHKLVQRITPAHSCTPADSRRTNSSCGLSAGHTRKGLILWKRLYSIPRAHYASFLAVSHIQEERTNFRVDAILAESVATGRVWDSFVLLPRILGCWGSFTRAFLPGRLVNNG